MSARDAGAVEALAAEIEGVGEVFASAPGLRDILLRPWVKGEDRRGAAVAVARRAGCGKLVQDFVGLLAGRGRLDHLAEIVSAYRVLVDQELNRVRAEVRTAVALTEEESRQLALRLERMLGKRVMLEQTVDSTLLGGFVAQVGSLILDASLDGQLARMRERLARAEG